jgi:hypothetical protein
MPHKVFRAPVASYNEANAFLTTLIQVGDGTWLGPSGTPTRPIKDDLVYWPMQFDPEATGSAIEKETFACHYFRDELAPEYPAPADIEELHPTDPDAAVAAYLAVRNEIYPPEQ